MSTSSVIGIIYIAASLVTGVNYGIEEPAYDLLLKPPTRDFAYEVRSYGSRVAVETPNDSNAFNRLAAYIGVSGTPQNQAAVPSAESVEDSESIDMTAPVVVTEPENIDMTAPVVVTEPESIDMTAPVIVTEPESIDMTAPVIITEPESIDMTAPVIITEPESIDMTAPVIITEPESIDMTAPVITTEPESIDMTAPVVVTEPEDIDMTAPVVTTSESENIATMQFILPTKYKSKEEAPVPLDENVWLVDLPPTKGAVFQYTCFATESKNKQYAEELLEQLKMDLGYEISNPSIEYMAYNPPFTNPFVRRNEVWVKLTDEQVNELEEKFARRRQMLRQN